MVIFYFLRSIRNNKIYNVFYCKSKRQIYGLCSHLPIQADLNFYCLVKCSCNGFFYPLMLTLPLEIMHRRATHLPFKCSVCHWQWWVTVALLGLWHFSHSITMITNSKVKSCLSPKDGYQAQVYDNPVGKWTRNGINWKKKKRKEEKKKLWLLMSEEKLRLEIKSDF